MSKGHRCDLYSSRTSVIQVNIELSIHSSSTLSFISIRPFHDSGQLLEEKNSRILQLGNHIITLKNSNQEGSRDASMLADKLAQYKQKYNLLKVEYIYKLGSS